MESKDFRKGLIGNVLLKTLRAIKNHPFIYIPFLIFALFEFITLTFIYLAPRMPLSLVLGPPIKTFWGEKYLHYPLNFLLLPKLTYLSRMVLSIFLGSLLSAMAIALIFDIYNKKQIKLVRSFKSALKKYISLLAVILILTLVYHYSQKLVTIGLVKYFISGHSKLLFLTPRIWLGPLLVGLNFLLALIAQSAFIYAIPVLVIDNGKLITAIFKSFVLFKKLFLPTLILVGLPMLIFIPILILQYNTSFLINKFFPESVLLVSIVSIIISSLVIDPLITILTTYLYLASREGIINKNQ